MPNQSNAVYSKGILWISLNCFCNIEEKLAAKAYIGLHPCCSRLVVFTQLCRKHAPVDMWKICQYICVQQPGFPLQENKLGLCQEEARRQLTRAGATVQNRDQAKMRA